MQCGEHPNFRYKPETALAARFLRPRSARYAESVRNYISQKARRFHPNIRYKMETALTVPFPRPLPAQYAVIRGELRLPEASAVSPLTSGTSRKRPWLPRFCGTAVPGRYAVIPGNYISQNALR